MAVEGPVVTNHSDIGLGAALQGLGIAYAFDREGVDEGLTRGRLVQVLADWSITRPGLFLYHPSRRHVPAALRAFIDCMLDRDLPRQRAQFQTLPLNGPRRAMLQVNTRLSRGPRRPSRHGQIGA